MTSAVLDKGQSMKLEMVQNVHPDTVSKPVQNEHPPEKSPNPLRIYTRSQLLHLQKSPLVKPPVAMPELKDWFGLENEQSLSRKDSAEPSTPNSARERRFRRDAEDGDTPTRPSFRSALSQPSQMGNFKHQSMRNNDRDADKDRDKEGLRTLSEKFDRGDRLPVSLGTPRGKERETAPPAGSSKTQGTSVPSVNNRRSDMREQGKKKTGEANEDWRRDPRRSPREDRTDNKDRDERPRREERDRDRRDNDKDDRRDPRRDRSKDKHRDRSRERREREPQPEDDDARHWRDDGKRDERMAARKVRDRNDPPRDNTNARGWTVVEERDGRPKRNAGRDKKSEELREKEDRRNDREKEKEPAWMDEYIPPPSSAGILGGQSADGELDGIQAWKKGLKDKEQKEKETLQSKLLPETSNESNAPQTPADATPSEKPMDEIQLFKLLMKREQEQKSPLGGVLDLAPVISDSSSPAHGTAATSSPQPSLLSLLTANKGIATPPGLTSEPPEESRPSGSRFFPLQEPAKEPSLSTPYNPPTSSRLLALGRSRNADLGELSPHSDLPPSYTGNISTTNGNKEMSRNASPFGDTTRFPLPLEQSHSSAVIPDHPRRSDLSWPETSPQVEHNPSFPNGKGSRFAKFFDGKGKDGPVPSNLSHSNASFGHAFPNAPTDHRAMDDIFAMLTNSTQRSMVNSVSPSHAGYNPTQAQLIQQQAQQHPPSNSRLEPLYESRTVDNRSFVPNELVPGLRSLPARRENHVYSDPMDDSLHLANQRIPQPLPRHQEQSYPGSLSSNFPLQSRGGLPPQHSSSFRGGPSPGIPHQTAIQGPMHRLPPGLANLGGRPPHEPSQFIGGPGLSPNLPHGVLQGLGNPQQAFHAPPFGSQHMRGPAGSMQSPNVGLQLNGLAHPTSLDPRNATQGHMLNLGLRGAGNGFGVPQQGPGGSPHTSLVMRPHQQQQPGHLHAPPHVIPHLLPQHLPQPNQTTNQTQDLMSLLMGGPSRD